MENREKPELGSFYGKSPAIVLLDAWDERDAMIMTYVFLNGKWPDGTPVHTDAPVVGIGDMQPNSYGDFLRFWSQYWGIDGLLYKEPKPWDPILLDRNRTQVGGVAYVTSIDVETNPYYQIWMSEIPTPNNKPSFFSPVYWEHNNDLGLMGISNETKNS